MPDGAKLGNGADFSRKHSDFLLITSKNKFTFHGLYLLLVVHLIFERPMHRVAKGDELFIQRSMIAFTMHKSMNL